MTTSLSPTASAFGESVPNESPLPSWNDGATKQSILDFVRGVTTTGGPQFVKPEERIAVFDNDGTLWSEQPFYFQLAFVLDRMKAMAPQHPEWKDNPLYAAVLEDDLKTVAAGGERGIARTCDDYPRRHDHRRVLKDCGGLDRKCQASKIQSSLHGPDFPADVGTACLFACQWLQDVYCLRRRSGIHACLGWRRCMGFRPSR